MPIRHLVLVCLVALACTSLAQDKLAGLTVPMTLGADNHIHISVRVNDGKPLDFIFDTGANICVLTELGKTKMANLSFKGAEKTLGGGGVTEHPVASPVKLSLQQRGWPNQSLMFIDYHGALRADGVIGYNLFLGKTVELDFDRGVLCVYDQAPRSALKTGAVNVTMKDDLAFIPLTISTGTESETDLFEVDTGFGSNLTVASVLAGRARLPGSLETFGKGKMGGTGKGIADITLVKLPHVEIGGENIVDVPTDVQQGSSRGFHSWNVIGNGIIKRFNVVWDIKGKKMYLSPSRYFSERYELPTNHRPLFVGSLLAVIAFCGGLFLYLKRRSA